MYTTNALSLLSLCIQLLYEGYHRLIYCLTIYSSQNMILNLSFNLYTKSIIAMYTTHAYILLSLNVVHKELIVHET